MLFDFPLQQWFDERTLVLRYAYIAFKLRSRVCGSTVFFLSLCVGKGKGKAVPNLNGSITMCSQRNILLYSVRQHNHFII
jgi:hypothetical protein